MALIIADKIKAPCQVSRNRYITKIKACNGLAKTVKLCLQGSSRGLLTRETTISYRNTDFILLRCNFGVYLYFHQRWAHIEMFTI